MRKLLMAVICLFWGMGEISAQSLIFEDDFEWGSPCAWSSDLWFPDGDVDLFGDEFGTGIGSDCPGPAGRVFNNRDCDDANSAVNPDATEVCDDVTDNDCDGFFDCDDGDCLGDPACTPPRPVINEVRYDDDGTDDFEYVELFHEDGNFDLTGYTMVHFNGANGDVDWAIDLSGVAIPADGYLVVGDPGVENLDVDWTPLGVNSLQNSEESLVLYTDWNGSSGTVVDALGWGEGAVAFMGEGSPAPEIAFGTWNNTIGRYPDGADSDDNSVDFVQTWWPTPGGSNTPAQPANYQRLTYSSEGITPLPVAIPDNNPSGLELSVEGPSWLGTSIGDLHVGVRIQHSHIGDLQVALESPMGSVALLHDQSGGSVDDLMTVYDLSTAPVDSLDVFNGENPVGSFWTLHVSDLGPGDVGEVVEWVLWIIEP